MKRSILIAASAVLCALSIAATFNQSSAAPSHSKRDQASKAHISAQKHAVRKQPRVARIVSRASVDPGCNIVFPCEGVAPRFSNEGKIVARNAREERLAARGKLLEERSPIGSARYTSAFGGSIVSIAQSQVGNGAIYGRRNLWCARFVNTVLQRAGYRGTGSDMASSFASFPRLSRPQVGALALYHRGRRGGHVGIVSGFASNGEPIIVSGNSGNRVTEGVHYRPAYAYVMPQ